MEHSDRNKICATEYCAFRRLDAIGGLKVLFLIACLWLLNGCFKVAPDTFSGCTNLENDEIRKNIYPHISMTIGINMQGKSGQEAFRVVELNSDIRVMDCPDRFEVYTYAKSQEQFLGRNWNYYFRKPDMKLEGKSRHCMEYTFHPHMLC